MHCENKEGLVDRIEREILFGGDLTAEQRQKLLEIANKCPVHRTLTSEILIETQLLDGLFCGPAVLNIYDGSEYGCKLFDVRLVPA